MWAVFWNTKSKPVYSTVSTELHKMPKLLRTKSKTREKNMTVTKKKLNKNMLYIIQEVQTFCFHLLWASTALTDKCIIAIFHRFAVNHRILRPAQIQRDLLPISRRHLCNGYITWEVWFKTSFNIHVRSGTCVLIWKNIWLNIQSRFIILQHSTDRWSTAGFRLSSLTNT